ncbi:MAG: cytochrome c biogenesis protein CcsA, partial [Chitinophagaceae bacterium]
MSLFFKVFVSVWILLTLLVGVFYPMPLTRNGETIRNMFYHVPMWFCMMIFFFLSIVNAIRYLNSNNNLRYDIYVLVYAQMGMLLGILGLVTGMVWAQVMWGNAWNNDPKQVGAAIALLGYLAYFILRRSLSDNEIRKAKISAVYNIFSFFMLFPTLWILPKMS